MIFSLTKQERWILTVIALLFALGLVGLVWF
jgi:hypothetical protein